MKIDQIGSKNKWMMAHVPKNGRQGCEEAVVDEGNHRRKMTLPAYLCLYLYSPPWIFVFVFSFVSVFDKAEKCHDGQYVLKFAILAKSK